MNNPKFKKGDICICNLKLSKRFRSGKEFTTHKKGAKVRIIKCKTNGKIYYYSVYNLHFKRYESIGEIYLTLDLEEIRKLHIDKILSTQK